MHYFFFAVYRGGALTQPCRTFPGASVRRGAEPLCVAAQGGTSVSDLNVAPVWQAAQCEISVLYGLLWRREWDIPNLGKAQCGIGGSRSGGRGGSCSSGGSRSSGRLAARDLGMHM